MGCLVHLDLRLEGGGLASVLNPAGKDQGLCKHTPVRRRLRYQDHIMGASSSVSRPLASKERLMSSQNCVDARAPRTYTGVRRATNAACTVSLVTQTVGALCLCTAVGRASALWRCPWVCRFSFRCHESGRWFMSASLLSASLSVSRPLAFCELLMLSQSCGDERAPRPYGGETGHQSRFSVVSLVTQTVGALCFCTAGLSGFCTSSLSMGLQVFSSESRARLMFHF